MLTLTTGTHTRGQNDALDALARFEDVLARTDEVIRLCVPDTLQALLDEIERLDAIIIGLHDSFMSDEAPCPLSDIEVTDPVRELVPLLRRHNARVSPLLPCRGLPGCGARVVPENPVCEDCEPHTTTGGA